MNSAKRLHKKSPPLGGSRHHVRNSDSGIGSFSDQDSTIANPDRSFTADDYASQRNNLSALREALKSASEDAAKWQAKCKQANIDVATKNKELRETEGRWRVLVGRQQVLEDERKTLFLERKELQRENAALKDEVQRLRASPVRHSPPRMSGALGEEQPMLRRRESKKDKERDAERQKRRLSQRFERDDTSEATAGSRGSQRDSYVEPWGRGGRRPRSSSFTAPPSRIPGINYTTSPAPAPVFAPPRQPTFANVPRTMPATHVDQVFDDYDEYEEDGNYNGHSYPLPQERLRRGRK